MIKGKPRRKVVRALARGQITIPREFRHALGINTDALLSVALVGNHLEIAPIREKQTDPRLYTEGEIKRFLEEDKIEPEVAEKVRQLIQRGEL